jgi:hypothetical protein
MRQRFRVYNTVSHDHIAVIEMEEQLLQKFVDDKILHAATLTFRGIKNGGIYTLLPVDDHTVTTLLRVQEVYQNVTEKPAKMFSTHFSRIDNLIEAVGWLFGEVDYTVVENADDLDKIINPPQDPNYQPKKVKYTVLGDLLKNAKEAAGIVDEPHVHGPGCGHNHP